jgi:hypothetical protein
MAPPARADRSSVSQLPYASEALPPKAPVERRVIRLTAPPMALEPYSDDAGPLSTSMRSMEFRSMVARLVAPAGRPSMSSSVCLAMPLNCGRKPRMPMPESSPGYWITSSAACFLSTSASSSAGVRSRSRCPITSIFCGSSTRSAG